MSTIASGLENTITNAVEGPATALAEKEIAALCAKIGITDQNAVAYFQAGADNIIKGVALSAEPLITRGVTAGLALVNKLFTKSGAVTATPAAK